VAKPKRVILFGAGASFGSRAVNPKPPPLSTDLFDELRSAYPAAWGQIPKQRRSLFVPNFEPGMKEIFESGSHDSTALLRALAHYFTQFRADHGNSYARLLEHLEANGILRGTLFSSLNYECVLETAARNYGFPLVAYFDRDATTKDAIAVWKIHGSCNFLPTAISAGAGVMSYAANAVSWDGDARLVDPSEARRFIESSAIYPAMAVFMEGKPIQSNPSLVRDLQARWATAVREAASVGVVGVSPNVADQHLWQPLSDTNARVVVVGDKKAYGKWADDYRGSRKTEIVGSKFDEALPAFAKALAS
jgi:hypothetical protein